MQINRRNALAALLVAPFLPTRASAACEESSDPPSLKKLGAEKALIVGSAISVFQLNEDDKALYASQLASVTPENSMKMSVIRPDRTAWKFERADAIVDYAVDNAMQVRGHALIWNNDRQPEWLNSLSKDEMQAVLDEHIERTMSRYTGRVRIWDVINEPIGTKPFGKFSLREGPFLERLGVDYVASSFRRARAVDPHAKLVLNETHTERDDSFGLGYRKALLTLLDHLLDQGVPIDGVGLQGHIQSGVPFRPDAFGAFLNEIARRGLFIEMTELDVNDDKFPDDVAARDLKVAEAYTRMLNVVLANEAVKSISFWQLADRNSHYYYTASYSKPSASRRPRPLLLDHRSRPKPAFNAVAEALRRAPIRD